MSAKDESDVFGPALAALDRMARADRRGTGCYLTAEMIEALSRTFMGQTWAEEPDAPRKARTKRAAVTSPPNHRSQSI